MNKTGANTGAYGNLILSISYNESNSHNLLVPSYEKGTQKRNASSEKDILAACQQMVESGVDHFGIHFKPNQNANLNQNGNLRKPG